MLEMILASSLIATIITVLFQYITNKRSDNLKYITIERSQWRKELRSIAEDIQNANQQNIKSVLVKKIFEDGELQKDSVIQDFRITAADGKNYNTKHYNLQAIIAVGFKVNNDRPARFRKWSGQIV